MSTTQQELATLLADLITAKPTTQADAMALLETIEFALAQWIVSDLPVIEAKAVLLEKWALTSVVEEVESGNCCGLCKWQG